MGHLHLMELVEEGGILILPTSKRGGEGREGEERERDVVQHNIIAIVSNLYAKYLSGSH